MRTYTFLAVLFCGAVPCLADSTVDAVLRSSPRLDAPGPGFAGRIPNNVETILFAPADGVKRAGEIKLDLISEPDFGFRPSRTNVSPGSQKFDLAR